ncbi:MAG: SsrA-binding protein SmpB [Propionibacteriaceae bacterium]|jgi:SsrA-binding protein|nr:SsrA-binding protein SmpB [Propionibacteriaceae bacterium]
MPKEQGRKLIAQNKKARHDYNILDRYEAGLVLVGTEVKSLRAGHCSLVDSYAAIEGGEAWLLGATIPEYSNGSWRNHNPKRKRKLLLNRREITKLEREIAQPGKTLVPLSIYFLDGRAKVEIAVASGKREWDKREAIKERDATREAQRALRSRNRLAR